MIRTNKSLFVLIANLIFLNFQSFSQSFEKIDSLANEICETINLISNQSESNGKSVSLDKVLSEVGKKHLDDYFSKIPSNKIDSTLLVIEMRLEKTCEKYGEIAYKQLENKGDWVRHNIKPKQKIESEDCKDFYKIKNYTYLETTGDKVKLEIRDGFWIDNLKDGTFSKLKMSINENCEFEIEFVESNNEMRKSFSKKGDKYKYTIIDSKKGFYTLSVEIPEQSIYYTFNLYYEE